MCVDYRHLILCDLWNRISTLIWSASSSSSSSSSSAATVADHKCYERWIEWHICLHLTMLNNKQLPTTANDANLYASLSPSTIITTKRKNDCYVLFFTIHFILDCLHDCIIIECGCVCGYLRPFSTCPSTLTTIQRKKGPIWFESNHLVMVKTFEPDYTNLCPLLCRVQIKYLTTRLPFSLI